MFRRILFSALLAGLIAGPLVSALHALKVTPLILEAEGYEAAARARAGGQLGEADAAGQGSAAWAPGDGIERAALSVLANVLIAVGFGLLMTAGFALRGDADWRQGLLWGLGGFAAVHLAPALGLPPEPPGTLAAGLSERQGWWLLTVALTASGLALLVFAPRIWIKVVGAALIAAPHVIGAPHPETDGGVLPAELAAAFVAASLVANALFWLVLGAACGFFFRRFGRA